jgi:hypothetical protein
MQMSIPIRNPILAAASVCALLAAACSSSAGPDTKYSIHGLATGQTLKQDKKIADCKNTGAFPGIFEFLIPGSPPIHQDGSDDSLFFKFTLHQKPNVVWDVSYEFTTSEGIEEVSKKIVTKYNLDPMQRVQTLGERGQEHEQQEGVIINDHLILAFTARPFNEGSSWTLKFIDTRLEQLEKDAVMAASKRPTIPNF